MSAKKPTRLEGAATPGPRFDGLGVVVTGASGGIGGAVAAAFAHAGARLCIVAAPIDEADLAKVARRIDAVPLAVDLGDESATASVIGRAVEALGRVDVLVNNAGFAVVEPAVDLAPERWDRLMAVNLRAPFMLSRDFARRARSLGHGGAIVNTASTNAFAVEPGLCAYNASKAGLVALTQTLALEFAPDGIRVNAVLPGMTRTRQTVQLLDDPQFGPAYLRSIPLGRFANPEDIAATYLFLASDAARYATGATFVIDGGLSVGLRWPEVVVQYDNTRFDA